MGSCACSKGWRSSAGALPTRPERSDPRRATRYAARAGRGVAQRPEPDLWEVSVVGSNPTTPTKNEINDLDIHPLGIPSLYGNHRHWIVSKTGLPKPLGLPARHSGDTECGRRLFLRELCGLHYTWRKAA